MRIHTIGFLFGLAVACGATQDVVKSVPDIGACIESIVATTTGSPDIAGIISHCGATVSDIEKVIADLEAQDAGAADGTVSAANPQRIAQIAMWKQALADYKATHPNAK